MTKVAGSRDPFAIIVKNVTLFSLEKRSINMIPGDKAKYANMFLQYICILPLGSFHYKILSLLIKFP